MIGRPLAFAIALIAAGALTPADASEPLTPWQFFREMMHAAPSIRQGLNRERPKTETFHEQAAPEGDATDAAGIPVPRPRPSRDGDPAAAAAEVAAAPAVKEAAELSDDQPAQAVPDTKVAPEPEVIPLRPGGGGKAAAFPFPVPRPKHDSVPDTTLAMFPTDPPPPVPTATSGESCAAALKVRGFDVSALAPIDEGRCTVPDPVAISALPGGVDLSTKAIVNCDVARNVASWLDGTVQPAAKKLGGRVTGLRIAASYDCRGRNRIKGAKLSEHGHGNAIDIAAFEIDDKRWIEVGPDWGKGADGAFLAEVRGEACGTFTTVLGPGSDPYHSDHIHLDRAKRRTAGPSKGLYCK